MPQVPKRNFHVPLTQELYSALQEQSEQLSTPATTLAREAIARWIDQREARVLAGDILVYRLWLDITSVKQARVNKPVVILGHQDRSSDQADSGTFLKAEQYQRS